MKVELKFETQKIKKNQLIFQVSQNKQQTQIVNE
jgi:hypothetical protein